MNWPKFKLIKNVHFRLYKKKNLLSLKRKLNFKNKIKN